MQIETKRLILRAWETKDEESYYNINQDPKVIVFLRGPLSKKDIEDFIAATNQHQSKHGYTLWAVELKATRKLIGFTGLNYIDWTNHALSGATEIGWRLGSQYWGQGYATEGARAALDYGFNIIGLKEIIAFTALANQCSLNVMIKLNMQHDVSRDFLHPKLPNNHALARHILYFINNQKTNA